MLTTDPAVPPQTARRRSRRLVLIVIAVVVVLVLVVAGSVAWFVLSTAPGRFATSTVTASGFAVRVEGATITGAAGVAPVGTPVRVVREPMALPASVRSFADLGGAVQVVLGDGKQPDSPVRIAFDVPQAGRSGRPYALTDHGGVTPWMDSTWDAATRRLTVTSGHLSRFGFAWIDPQRLADRFGQGVETFLGSQSSRPDCVGRSATVAAGSVTVDEPPDSVAWPCVKVGADGRLLLTLQSNSPLSWLVRSAPAGATQPLAEASIAGAIYAAVAQQLYPAGGATGPLLREGELTIVYTDPPQRVALRADPVLTQIAAVVAGLTMLVPENAMHAVEVEECMVGVAKGGGRASAEAARATVGCVANGVKGALGGIVGILLKLPSLLVANLEGIVREATAASVVELTVRLGPSPDGGTPLHDVPSTSTQRSGRQVQVSYLDAAGSTITAKDATEQWVGCPSPAITTYSLGGAYTSLNWTFVLADFIPAGLTAHLIVTVDGRRAVSTSVRGGVPLSGMIDVSGGQRLTVAASTEDRCGSSSQGYGAFVDTTLRRAG